MCTIQIPHPMWGSSFSYHLTLYIRYWYFLFVWNSFWLAQFGGQFLPYGFQLCAIASPYLFVWVVRFQRWHCWSLLAFSSGRWWNTRFIGFFSTSIQAAIGQCSLCYFLYLEKGMCHVCTYCAWRFPLLQVLSFCVVKLIFVTGETLFIIFFMAVIISIPWMVYGWFFLLRQQLFSLYQYVGFNHRFIFYLRTLFFNNFRQIQKIQFPVVKTAFLKLKIITLSIPWLLLHLIFRGQTMHWQSHFICLINEEKTLKKNKYLEGIHQILHENPLD